MSRACLVGIDLGTSSLKTVLLDPEGNVLSQAGMEYPIHTPKPGWAEQDPEHWYRALVTALRKTLSTAQVSPYEITAIGLAGQMHGMVCLDGLGNVLRPAIIWPDQRSYAQVESLEQNIGRKQLGQWIRNPVATGFMLPSWLWLCENEPKIAQKTTCLLLPKDALRYRLTGMIGTDPSDASATSLFDPASRRWSSALLSTLQINPDLLPAVMPSTAQAGELDRKTAEATGLLPGTPVVVGGSDQACQAIGQGVIEPGLLSCTIGTGGQLFAPTLTPEYDPELRMHLFCHAIPDMWHLEAATLSAGLSLRWLRDRILDGLGYSQMADLAASIPAGSEGLFFLPYLVGERTPHMDPLAKGGFIGLTLSHSKAHLVRAVMEGVVFALQQGLELMATVGARVDRIVASGGTTAHPLWLQLQADIFNRPIYISKTEEAAATGAALLTGIGTGVYADAQEACRRAVRYQERVVEPNPANIQTYITASRIFRQLYPALSGFYQTPSPLS